MSVAAAEAGVRTFAPGQSNPRVTEYHAHTNLRGYDDKGLPLVFLLGMAMGFGLGLQQPAQRWSEWGILVSVLWLGVLIAQPWRLPLASAVLAVALFGVCHGYAHGSEFPAQATPWAFSLGFLGTSAGLHVMGAIVGLLFQQQSRPLRHFALTGGAICTLGALIAAQVLLGAAAPVGVGGRAQNNLHHLPLG